MQEVKPFPRYRSHKIVWALKIGSIIAPTPEHQTQPFMIVPDNTEYAAFAVSREYVERFNPTAGGYYVRYADGYESVSPAAAFDGGYISVEELCVSAVTTLTPGHRYVLPNFENKTNPGQVIQFIEKKKVDRLPENGGPYFETVNDGTTNEAVLEMLIDRLLLMNEKLPNKDTSCAITHLEDALLRLNKRTSDRLKRGV